MASTPSDRENHPSKGRTRRTPPAVAFAVAVATGVVLTIVIALEGRWLSGQSPASNIGTVQVSDLITIQPRNPQSSHRPSTTTNRPLQGATDDD